MACLKKLHQNLAAGNKDTCKDVSHDGLHLCSPNHEARVLMTKL
jgi:hypothetical protein